MAAAILTAFLFALSAAFSQRTARLMGPLEANAARLAIACAALAVITWIVDATRGVQSVHPSVFPALLLSGVIGFGIGDIGLFLAYPRLGSRLTILINFSTGTLFGAAGDWIWFGQSLSGGQWGGVMLILAGLAVALWPRAPGHGTVVPVAGILLAVLAGFGQGFGTTVTGYANRLAEEGAISVHGISQAFQRSIAGVLVAAGALAVWRIRGRRLPEGPEPVRADGPAAPRSRMAFWLTGTALFGPVLGVSCYQWARLQLPTAIVVAVAATSTLLIIPLAYVTERELPTVRQFTGTVLAAAGIIWLCLVRGA